MKRSIPHLCIVFLIATSTMLAQYNEIETLDLSADEVPMEVLANHRSRFPGSFNYEWQRQNARFIDLDESTHFVVHFKKDGRMGHKAFYDANYNFVAYVGFVQNLNLPESIQDQAPEFLLGSYVKSGEIIEMGAPSMFIYRVRVNSQGLLKYLYFDKYGNILDKRNLSPKVFSFI